MDRYGGEMPAVHRTFGRSGCSGGRLLRRQRWPPPRLRRRRQSPLPVAGASGDDHLLTMLLQQPRTCTPFCARLLGFGQARGRNRLGAVRAAGGTSVSVDLSSRSVPTRRRWRLGAGAADVETTPAKVTGEKFQGHNQPVAAVGLESTEKHVPALSLAPILSSSRAARWPWTRAAT